LYYQHNNFPFSNDNGEGNCYNYTAPLHLPATMVETVAAMTQHNISSPTVMVEVIVAMMQHLSFFLTAMVEAVVVVLLL
jgi:hypothetical protein